MKSIYKHIILYIFLISSILLNGLIIGTYSIRIYVSVIILIYLISNKAKFPLKKEVKWYILFIIFYWIALNVNGEIKEINFFKYLFGRYLICLIAIYATSSMIKEPKTLYNIIVLLVIIGVINGIVSIMQFSGNSQALIITSILHPTEYYQERFESYGEFDSGLGIGVVGLFGSIVKNGYLSSVFAVLSLYIYNYSKRIPIKILCLIASFFLLYTVFLTQQRFVSIATALFFLFYFYQNKKMFFTLLIISIASFILFVDSESLFNQENIGRLSNLYDETRIKLFNLSLQFISENLFFGGQMAFARFLESNGLIVLSAHNIIFNAFIYSGVFGAFFVILVYFKMLIQGVKIILSKLHYNSTSFFIAGSLAIYLLNSLTHNASLVSGDEIIWILYIMLLKSNIFIKSKQLHL